MSWASITDNLGLGRYRIKIDSGESRRVALLNAANQGLAIVGGKLIAAQEQVDHADALEAEARDNINGLISALVLENDPVAVELARKVLDIEQQKYARLVASNQPARQQYATLKDAQADLLKQRAKWAELQTIVYKEAWCTDYTLNGSGDVVATIDIPGDPSLTLLAPGCRGFRSGDGMISIANKTAALSKRSKELIRAGSTLSTIEEQLAKETAAEVALRAEVAAAQAAYTATPTDENYTIFERKAAELNAARRTIANLQVSKSVVTVTINRLNQEIAYWSSRSAVEVPVPGDGAFLDRALVSPAQAYFNAAIFPGWQKFLPTYRWGIASDVDDDANVMTVTLGPATSRAQGLDVNAAQVLHRVPITYMTCNSNAFFDDDRVIVQFENQQQASPRVIGFLDNPKECILYTYLIFVYGDLVENYANKKAGFAIPTQVAPSIEELTPSDTDYYGERAFGRFLGWFKTGGTDADPINPFTTSHTLENLRVLRSDPRVGEGATSYSAEYYLFPQYITGQYGTFTRLSFDNFTSWTLGQDFEAPAPDAWDYVVQGTETDHQAIDLYFGDSIPISGTPIQVGNGLVISLSHTGITWTTDFDANIVSGFVFVPPNPLEQYHPETWDPPFYAAPSGRADLANYAPVLVLETIYGTAIYALDAALNASIARWKIQSLV
jgi:hypothetical protein